MLAGLRQLRGQNVSGTGDTHVAEGLPRREDLAVRQRRERDLSVIVAQNKGVRTVPQGAPDKHAARVLEARR